MIFLKTDYWALAESHTLLFLPKSYLTLVTHLHLFIQADQILGEVLITQESLEEAEQLESTITEKSLIISVVRSFFHDFIRCMKMNWFLRFSAVFAQLSCFALGWLFPPSF